MLDLKTNNSPINTKNQPPLTLRERTSNYISKYLNPNVKWDFNISVQSQMDHISKSDVDWDVVSSYIKRMEYLKFLNTPYWKAVSAYVKHKARYRCQICNCSKNLATHHRTYTIHGSEHAHLHDLTVLCNTCHELFHQKKNKKTFRFSHSYYRLNSTYKSYRPSEKPSPYTYTTNNNLDKQLNEKNSPYKPHRSSEKPILYAYTTNNNLDKQLNERDSIPGFIWVIIGIAAFFFFISLGMVTSKPVEPSSVKQQTQTSQTSKNSKQHLRKNPHPQVRDKQPTARERTKKSYPKKTKQTLLSTSKK